MNVTQQLVDMAENQARHSKHKFRVGAVVFKRKRACGFGFNDAIKTHPKSNHPFHSIHAELAAVLNAVKTQGDINGLSIYIHRILKDGSSALARPCQWCAKLLAQVGIEDIHYSI